jgi:hypothetical protein
MRRLTPLPASRDFVGCSPIPNESLDGLFRRAGRRINPAFRGYQRDFIGKFRVSALSSPCSEAQESRTPDA